MGAANMRRFSYSRLNQWDRCRLAFYYKYVLEMPDEAGAAAKFGTACHTIIEQLFENGWENLDLLISAVGKAMRLDLAELRDCVNAKRVKEVVEQDGWIPEDSTIVYLDDDPEDPLELIFIPDFYRMDGRELTIGDWKTNQRLYMPTENRQLPLYAAALRKIRPDITDVYGHLHFLRFHTVKQEEIPREVSDEAWLWAQNTANEIIGILIDYDSGGEIEELFPKGTPDKCAWCSYRNHCYQKLEVPLNVTSIDEAKKAIDYLVEIGRHDKAVTEALKTFVTKTGDIKTGDGYIAHFDISDTWRMSGAMEAIEEYLNTQGLLESCKALDNKLIIRTVPEAQLLELGAKKSSTKRFKFDKNGGTAA